MEIEIDYEPRGAFIPYHERTKRFSLIVAHRRAGKTVATINDLIKSALQNKRPEPRLAYLAPFYNQAKDIAWGYLKKYSQPLLSAPPNESELRVDLINGARIRLYGADNPDRMRGLYLDDVVLDEYADMKPSIWGEVIRPLLSDRNGSATFIGTPKGHNDFYKLCKQSQNDPDWLNLILRASQTGLIPALELAAVRKDMTPEQYEQEFECSFEAAITGAYYGRELSQADKDGRICSVPVDRASPVHTAWDLGYSDDTAIWFYQVVRGEIHIVDFYSASGRDIDHYAEIILKRGYKYGVHWLPHDAKAKTLASGGKSIQEQLSAHLGWGAIRIVPQLSLEDGIQAARKAFPRMYFDVGCDAGLEALRQYQREWDDDRKCFREQPRHDWTSHPADAFRYLAVAWQEDYKPAPVPVDENNDPWGRTFNNEDDWKSA